MKIAFCPIYLHPDTHHQFVKMLKINFSKKRRCLLPAIIFLLVILQSCAANHYNSRSRGYMRTPPSTGRNRCGCLLPEKHVNQIEYACFHVQKG